MFRQYYPNELRSPEPDGGGGGGVSESYDEKCDIDGKIYEVHVENKDGKSQVFPKGEYDNWGDPILSEKLNADLVHKAKKSQQVLKDNNDSNKALQEYEARLKKLEEDNLRKEGIIEALQKVGTPQKVDKQPKSETEEFDEVAEAYKLAGVSSPEDWDDLTPSQRFTAQSKASQARSRHEQLQLMKQLSENTSKTNQQFMMEQKLSSMIVQAGLDPQQARADMEAHGVMYGEAGVNFYINSIKQNLKPKNQKDAIDEVNKRTELYNRNHNIDPRGSQSGFQIMTPEDKKLKQFSEAVKGSNVDANQLANQILGFK